VFPKELREQVLGTWKMREEDAEERQNQQVTLLITFVYHSPLDNMELLIRSSSPVPPSSLQHQASSSEAFGSEFTLGDLPARYQVEVAME
jgi:hypothetical protein